MLLLGWNRRTNNRRSHRHCQSFLPHLYIDPARALVLATTSPCGNTKIYSTRRNPTLANQNQRCQLLKQPPPPEPVYTMSRPPWPDISNGVWPLSLDMTANNLKRYRPLFNVIPPFILGFPTSFAGNMIPCRAAEQTESKRRQGKCLRLGRYNHPPCNHHQNHGWSVLKKRLEKRLSCIS